MLTPKLQELAQFKAKVEKLERAILSERRALLDRLHLEVGFESPGELIEALQAVGKSPGKPERKSGSARSTKAGKRRRAKITPELRDSIIGAIRGGATSGTAAARFKVSLPTVQNIKRAAGLTRHAGGKK